MKKFFLFSCIFIFLLSGFTAYSQVKDEEQINFPKLDTSPLDLLLLRNAEDEPYIRVLYSRPQVRGRDIFGKLIPYGKIWRTGANEAVEVTFYKDMRIGNKIVKAGNYSLFTIPEENEWTVILNEITNTWGAYDYNEADDVVRIKVPVRKTSTPIEALSMKYEPIPNGTNLIIGWDDRYVKVPFMKAN